MEYILDTNICIYIIKRKPVSVLKKFSGLTVGNVGISTITLAELQYGVMKSSDPSKNSAALEKFLTSFEIVEFDIQACIEYGVIRSFLEKQGTPIGPLDTLIASHAKSLGVVLVSNNLKEFERIPGLLVENWVS